MLVLGVLSSHKEQVVLFSSKYAKHIDGIAKYLTKAILPVNEIANYTKETIDKIRQADLELQ